ncbi:PREDICTED: inactive TPR repeat-containing thioredoxin TTL3 [Tarenaya hassleriana]|uniref:inactive TPR repeat-containing thioredoxin TTL3 n=1 Tax=Tarenaya hassleriana TaxID=28532 RepID=UPI00053C714F|nr:PREDICTED: inactive TPR repeat-containing thioredoxin TTL3 [Tarenaya hassleriana]
MVKLKTISTERKLGCGSLLGGFFQSWSPRRRKPCLPEKPPEEPYLPPKSTTTTNPPRKLAETPKKKPKPDEHFPRKSSDSGRVSNSSTSSRTDAKRLVGNGVMGNIIVKHPSSLVAVERRKGREGKTLNRRLEPEVLKSMGNEEYSRGRFREALVLYERAISTDPKTATYWCNKSAALISLGRLLEACDACEEAIRLDPSYERAHHRLGTLYVRLGEAAKALEHYKRAGKHVEMKHVEQVHDVIRSIKRCEDARKSREWNILLKETSFAISYGADSSPRVHALETEALLQLRRHEEAYNTYKKGTKLFNIDGFIKISGLPATSYLLTVGAQVYIAAGRFEDAVTASQKAARLDPSNGEISRVGRRARAVASARLSGNLLFKASKFDLACVVYTEGLDHDPYNALLLCNRAACRYKLNQFEKALEDCTSALHLQPSYTKARRRRAESYVKLEKWQLAIQDYELLMIETPGDEEIRRSLAEAKGRLSQQSGGYVHMGTGSDLVLVNRVEKSSGELLTQSV